LKWRRFAGSRRSDHNVFSSANWFTLKAGVNDPMTWQEEDV
jgi:hypothetical protein